jgi:uncharacterized RDD family membrane protein YckC
MTDPLDPRDPRSAEDDPGEGRAADDQPTVAWAPSSPPPGDGPGVDAAPPARDAGPPVDPFAPGSAGVAGMTTPPPPIAEPATPAPAESSATPSAWRRDDASPVPSPLLSASPAPVVAWAQPAAPPTEVAPGLVYASTGSRLVAYIIDAFILGVIANIVGQVLGVQTFASRISPTGDLVSAGGAAAAGAAILSVALSAVYFVASWSGGRRGTLGQRLLSIQVGNVVDGVPLRLEQAVRRWIGLGDVLGLLAIAPIAVLADGALQFIWAVVLLISVATSPTKQGLHDRFAGSALVRPTTAGNGLANACLVIVVIVALLAILSIVALIFLGGQVSSILSSVGESV